MTTSPTPLASAIPDAETMTNAAKLQIMDSKGAKVTFGSLFENQKTIVVFINEAPTIDFFPTMYVEQLATIPQEILDKAGTRIAVVGCGDWQPIQSYAEMTTFSGPIYADPSRSLYRTLGMKIEKLEGTPSGLKRKSYVTVSPLKNALQSIWKGPLKHPSLIGKQGNISQLGGELIIGPGLTCSFASHMRHTEDHAEIVELLEKAGVKYS
ncbi:hypothetical protein C0995_014998 [Termitomyces sp. Mi166|nr:hypothetical protein C0995_014998 [Termitomyces sp. Mi166\